MGWTVLYIAFGVVALWLLGEVLLQYKARLRWRLLAFGGFLAVVVGTTALPSVIVIGLGIAAFALGQTFVTLSVRSGFTEGWTYRGPGASRRRRAGGTPGAADPSLEVTDLRTHGPGAESAPFADAPETTPVQVPLPEPVDDYGQAGYGQTGYGPSGYDQPGGAESAESAGYADPGYAGTPGHDPMPGYDQQPAWEGHQGYVPSPGYGGYEEEPSVFGGAPGETQAYAYDAGPGGPYPARGYPDYPDYAQPAGHTDPFHQGTGADDSAYQSAFGYPEHTPYPDYQAYQESPDPYGGYGTFGAEEQGQYAGYGYPATPQQPYYPGVPETPPGGVWVPQQRDGTPPPPQDQSQDPYGYGAEPVEGAPYGDGSADGWAQQPQAHPYPQGYYGDGRH
ncbi:hypothetical protein [Streptomyces diacarni]|uniref:hypothetical protein n=1 Tax=Streptomyces diacarni TaxID=2800381 RepID=UPI0015F08BA1|nr:hypothetical protein [Streptomyces diacarni]